MLVPDQPKRKNKREGKRHRKYGRKHRNGKPFGRGGDCGCITCRLHSSR
jgi:hypothetical protein